MRNQKIEVAILGATGPVGQKAISMLSEHPNFIIRELAASDSNQGKIYGEIVQWKNEYALPETIARMQLKNALEVQSKYVISALPADIAMEVEPALAKRGQFVFSNAAAYRMDPNTPLLIPEINLSHLSLLEKQKTPGKIITNPNCSTVFMALALAPLQALGKVEHVSVVTMQSLSGAGYPGVSAFDLLGNVIPHISGEEDKIRDESKKILGAPDKFADFKVTVHVHRVPVLYGHTIAMHIRFDRAIDPAAAYRAYLGWNERFPNLFQMHDAPDRPQPLRDLTPHDMRVHIGRIKSGDEANTIGLISIGHNLVRGAAGAAIFNMYAHLRHIGELA